MSPQEVTKWLKISTYCGDLLVEEEVYTVLVFSEAEYQETLRAVTASKADMGLAVIVEELTEQEWKLEEFAYILTLPGWEEVDGDDLPERIGEN
jgi:hypothetical protein